MRISISPKLRRTRRSASSSPSAARDSVRSKSSYIRSALAAAIGLTSLGLTAARAEIDCEKFAKDPASYPDYKPTDIQAPMRFYKSQTDVCRGTALEWPYLAVGTITEATPAAFAEFAKKNAPNVPIAFTSPGGSVLAALKLGEMIRNDGYDTSLGEFCASACT
jgi:hypothetical protein